jgi:hypothetical protein
MPATPRRTPAHQTLINVLHHFHILCGSPAYDDIVDVVGRIGTCYPDFSGGRHETGLSRTNLYKILNGRHDSLPTAPQLSRIVLALQHLAHREGVVRDDPGHASLAGWHALLSEAKVLDREQRDSGLLVADTRPIPVKPTRMPTAPPMTDLSGAPAEPVSLTDSEVYYLTTLGPYARRLALRATTGGSGVLYEVAVLLAVGGTPYNRRAGAIAANAAAAGLPAAADLCSADAAITPEVAAVHARVLAYAAARRVDQHDQHDQDDAAHLFAGCAARADFLGVEGKAPRPLL